jgi:hypothetical protein
VSNTQCAASNDWMNELSRVQKRLWPTLKHFPGIYLKDLRKNTKILIQNTALDEIHTPSPPPKAPQKHCRPVRGGGGGSDWWVHLVRQPPLGLFQPRMTDGYVCRAVGGMRIGRGNRSTRREPAIFPFCSPQMSHDTDLG